MDFLPGWAVLLIAGTLIAVLIGVALYDGSKKKDEDRS